MPSVMTNTEFCKKLKDIALNYKTLYVMGCFGAPMNASNKQRYINAYPYNKAEDRKKMIEAATADTFGFDCVCLIKGVLWSWAGDKSKVYGGASYQSNGVPDIDTESMIGVCSNVSTDFSKITPGEVVWLKGHIGVYIGDGLVVECTPKWDNKVQITSLGNTGGKAGYNKRTWTKHGKLPYIKYEESQPSAPTSPAQKALAKGIDVSKWNEKIDWNKVKASGISFAMIRLGYGSADGKSCGMDTYFETNVANAIKAGVHVGCYFYSYAKSVDAVKREAEFVINILKQYKGAFTYPVAFDIEDPTQIGLGKTTLTNMVIAFCDAIERAGFYASIYSNLNWLKNYLDDSKISRFDHWLAQWAAKPTYTKAFGMWQYSAEGGVSGIEGAVDMDEAYKDYPQTIRSKKLNGFTSASQAPKAPKPIEPPQPAPTPSPAPSPSTPTASIGVNDVVKITGKKYYDGKSVPLWVRAKNWVVSSISGNRVVLNKSEDGKSSIMSPFNASDLTLVKKYNPREHFVEIGDTVKIIGTRYYSGATIPSWVRKINWVVYNASDNSDRVVLNKSADGKYSIMSPVRRSDLQVVSKKR